ncbi:MAG: LPXTG cell wall anchor domain-containing protein, partial [Clostridiaceae bacterium]|nr:LPXTG cell wall anchor domain-containing protein [Clostridiaceae bacterium]
LYSSTASGTEGALLDTVKNIGGGFTFERTFTAADTYYYLVKETVGTLGGVTYDLTEYLVKIVISDNLAGALARESLDVMVFDTEAWIESHLAFNNKYTPPAVLVPDIEVKKSVAEEIFSEAGDELHYSFTVTNTGDLAFVKLIVNDPRLGIVDLEIDLSADPLLPGETYTHVFTEPYIVTDADADAKAPIINTITVVGETAQGIKAEDEDSVTVPFEQTEPHIPPIISLVKKVKEDSFSKAGDLLHYYFTVTNEGVVPIVKLTLNDPKLGIKNVVIDISATPLMPGESYTYAFSQAYVVTEADVANGKIVNVLTVKGETVEGAEVEVKDDLTTPMEQILPHIPATGENFNHWAAIAVLLLGGAVALIAIMRRRKSH